MQVNDKEETELVHREILRWGKLKRRGRHEQKKAETKGEQRYGRKVICLAAACSDGVGKENAGVTKECTFLCTLVYGLQNTSTPL